MKIHPQVAELLTSLGVSLSGLISAVDAAEAKGQLIRQDESYRVKGVKTPTLLIDRHEQKSADLAGCTDSTLLACHFAAWHSHVARGFRLWGEKDLGARLPSSLVLLPKVYPHRTKAAPAKAPAPAPAATSK